MKYRLRRTLLEWLVEFEMCYEYPTFPQGFSGTMVLLSEYGPWLTGYRFWRRRNAIIQCTKLALEGHEVDFGGYV